MSSFEFISPSLPHLSLCSLILASEAIIRRVSIHVSITVHLPKYLPKSAHRHR